MQGNGSTDNIIPIMEGLSDIEHHMLHFLENHDEQRIASREFAGSAGKGKPAMVVSATISTSPTMVYFGQEVGEPGDGNPGFGSETRTTIYDYWGVPNHVKWVNGGTFDGGHLDPDEKALREFYVTLLNFSRQSRALTGHYREIHSSNRSQTEWYNDRVFSFVRWKGDDRLIIISNFSGEEGYGFELQLPPDLVEAWGLANGVYPLEDQLGEQRFELRVSDGMARVRIDIGPLESFILAPGS
jgi:hypothetical protein